MPLIHLDDIWKAYGANDVLTGISWQIDPGERIGLVGHNGCGKTTLFSMLTGLGLPDRGNIHRQRNTRVIAARTGQPLERIERDTDRDFWMGPEESVDYGLVGKIIHSMDELPA